MPINETGDLPEQPLAGRGHLLATFEDSQQRVLRVLLHVASHGGVPLASPPASPTDDLTRDGNEQAAEN